MKIIDVKRAVCILLALVLSLSINVLPLSAESAGFYEDFENATLMEAPDSMDCMQGAGDIRVIDTESEYGKAVFLECANDGAFVAVEKETGAFYSSYPVCARVSFRQPGVRADGSAILQVYSGASCLVSIETNGNGIAYRTADGYEELLPAYETDRFYDVSATVDLTAQTAMVCVDSVSCEIPLLAAASSVDGIKSYCRLSPGIILDNISVGYVVKLNAIEVTGPQKQGIPPSKNVTYTYRARAVDNRNNTITGVSFAWELAPVLEGVSLKIVEDGASAGITVESGAPENGEYRLRVKAVEDPSVFCEYKIALQKGAVSGIAISGAGVLVPGIAEEVQLTAKAHDSFGNELETEDVIFRLKEVHPDFSVSSSGRVTLKNPNTQEKFITIAASYADDETICAEKRIRIDDYRTYLNDMARRSNVKDYMDRVLEDAHDTYRGTPLLANGIDKDGRHVLWDFINGDHSAMTDIGNQQDLMRTMMAYSAITGDKTYENRAMEIYRYTLENNVQSNLVLWGPHASMDLKTGKRAAGNGYHEVEDKNMYLAPFFDIDPEKAAAIVKQTWMGHIIKWDSLWFNRHATYGKVVQEASTWSNTEQFIENPEDPFIRDHEGQSFFIAASEYIHFATELYKETGDETALLWAKRLCYKYVNAKDSITGMLPLTFTSGYGAPGTKEMPPEIWEMATMPYQYQTTNYGDRAYNQFAQPLYDAGKISKDEMEHIIEAYFYQDYPWVYSSGMLEVFEVAKLLGLEDENDEGFDLLYQWLTAMDTYLKTGYDSGGNAAYPMFACGVKLHGYQTVRCGYYGSRGRIFSSGKVSSEALLSVIHAALISQDFEALSGPNETFWKTARSMGKGFQLGDIGDPLHGIKPELNFNTASQDPIFIDALVLLYERTQEEDYLKLARLIANNICENKFSDNLFVDSETYSTWISMHEPLALMKLDAAINGMEIDALDYLYPSNTYLQERWVDDHGYVDETNQHSDKYSLTYTPVKVKEIVVETDEIVMKKGEAMELAVEVLPDDATTKTLFWEIDDQSVVSIDFSNTIYAHAKGETYIRAVAAESPVLSKRVKVIVE